MIVVFPFEKKFYSDAGVEVEYVGHPLIDRLRTFSFADKEMFCSQYNLAPNKEILLIMPGSRDHEIAKIFPEAIKAAERIAKEHNFQIVVACPENIDEKVFENYRETEFKVISNQSYNLLKLSSFGIIKSGTSTMEAAVIGLPFVVVYSTSALTYWIGKSLVKLNSIAMPNIIAGKQIIKEFIQNDLTKDKLYGYISLLLMNKERIFTLKKELENVKDELGQKSAPKLAAEIICSQG